MNVRLQVIPTNKISRPKSEDGYTRLPNELFDALLSGSLSRNELKVAFAIVRKTSGYNKAEDDVSASQLAKICNMQRPHVTETLNSLARKNVINKRPGVHGSIVSIQTDYSCWMKSPPHGVNGAPHADLVARHYTYRVTNNITGEFYIGVRTCKCAPGQDRYLGSGRWPSKTEKHNLTKIITGEFATREEAHVAKQAQIQEMVGNSLMMDIILSQSDEAPRPDSEQGVQDLKPGSTESVHEAVQISYTQKTTTKDNRQKTKISSSPKAATANESAAFVEFYQAYPRRCHRKEASRAYAKLDPDAELKAAILAGLARCKKQEQWRNPKFIPHPATWLNAGGWMDEVQTEYAAAELEVIRSYNEALADTVGAIDEAIFSESRAAAIRAFRKLSGKPEFWLRFFPWIREKVKLPSYAGFDWLITPEGFSIVKGGKYNK